MIAHIDDLWRAWLYPIGFLALIAYGLRFLVQWIESEKKKRTVVPPLFWKLSLVGNGILFIHSYIQGHFPMCLVQLVNSVLFWRNLNLLGPTEKRVSFKKVICIMIVAAISASLLFLTQILFFHISWISSPWSLGMALPKQVSAWVHVLGLLGIASYSGRFWIQWWQAEKKKESTLSPTFWWLSLFGASVSTLYFSLLCDWVNLTAAVLSFIPYSRNLWLGRKSSSPPKEKTASLFIFAGEVSADLYGKELLVKLKREFSHLTFWGVGGPEMKKENFSLLFPMEDFRVMGFTDVLLSLPRLIHRFFSIKRAILKQNPELVLCIDQPTFTMRLARSLRKSGYKGKIVQFVAPTVWAWKKERAEKMARHFDLLLTLFDFEPSYFSHTSMQTVFVGHPMLDIVEKKGDSHSLDLFGLDPSRPILAIFPGSRPHEIKRNFQKQLEAASLFCQKYPEVQIAACTAEKIDLGSHKIHLVPFAARYELMKQSMLAIAKSGTVTLELAMSGVPTVVTYELSLLNRLMLTHIYKLSLPFYCIVNILSQKELFFELIRPPVTALEIGQKLELWHTDEALRSSCKNECFKLRERLKTDRQPMTKAAEEISALLQKTT